MGIRKMADSITSKELKALLEKDPETVLLDVRRKVDYEAAPRTIGRAAWRDPEKIDEWADQIPKNRKVVVYCVKGGSVSQSTAGRLQQSHSDVRFLLGGLKSWEESEESVG
jgi:rhodanese-related sulfurtransferase